MFLAATATMSSTSPPPDTSAGDSAAAGTTSSNFTLLYIIIAVLVGVVLYLAIGYGRSVLSEWRHLRAAANGTRPASRHGLSVDDIAALPTFTYRARAPTPSPQSSRGGRKSGSGSGKRRSGSKGRAAVECVVCLQELENGDVVRVLPACRHFFHSSCIDAWLCAHSSCPVCRAYPEPERAQLGELALSPPLPQLRPCGVSPERPAAAGILADILARSPLRRIGASTSGSNETIMSKSNSTSPAPTAGDYILSRSPSQTPLTLGRMVDERSSVSASSPEMTEILVVHSTSPSPIRFFRESTTRCVGVLERIDVIHGEDEGLSKPPSPVPH